MGPTLLVLSAALSYYYAGYQLPGADEGALLTNAAKLLRGGVFYRDIDAYPFPLATYLAASAFGAFGEHLSVSRALAGLLFCVTLLALYATALHLVDRRRAALFGAMLLAFKFLAYPSFTAYTYWDLSFCFACIAVLLLVGHSFRGATPRLALAGLAVGLSLVSKQSLGIYLGAISGALLLLPGPLLGVRRTDPRNRLSELAVFGVASLVPFVMLAAYFASHDVLWNMLRSGLLAPFTSYVGTSSIPFSAPLAWWKLGQLSGASGIQYQPDLAWQLLSGERLPGFAWYPVYWLVLEVFARMLYTSVPLAFVGVAWLWGRGGRSRVDPQLVLVGALAFGAVLSAFPRADYPHVISVYPIVALVLFGLLARVDRWRESIWRLQVVAVAALLLASAWLTSVNHSHLTHRVDLERADVWVSPRSWVESVVKFVDAELAEDDPLFVYGQEADYYFLTGRFSPWRFAQLYPGQAGGDGGRTLVALLRNAEPPLVIRGMMGWPGLPLLRKYVPRFERTIGRSFRVETEVFERFPLPAGGQPPPWWVLSVLRPCEAPVARCDSWNDFAGRQPPPR